MLKAAALKSAVKLKVKCAKENNMAQRDDSKEIKEGFLKGYGDGTEFQKGRNKLYGAQVNKGLTNVEDVTSDMDKLRNPGKYASNARNIVMPSPYLSGKVKGASDMAIAIEKEKEYKDTVDYLNPKAKKSKAEYPDQQKELKDLYETGISDKDIAAAKEKKFKKGGKVKTKCMASGGKVSQLAKANGCAVKGKSRGRIV